MENLKEMAPNRNHPPESEKNETPNESLQGQRISFGLAPKKKMVMNILNWRVIYQLFSGLLFISLSIVILLKAKGLTNIPNVRVFGSLLFAYGVYRIIVFIKYLKKTKEGCQ